RTDHVPSRNILLGGARSHPGPLSATLPRIDHDPDRRGHPSSYVPPYRQIADQGGNLQVYLWIGHTYYIIGTHFDPRRTDEERIDRSNRCCSWNRSCHNECVGARS